MKRGQARLKAEEHVSPEKVPILKEIGAKANLVCSISRSKKLKGRSDEVVMNMSEHYAEEKKKAR